MEDGPWSSESGVDTNTTLFPPPHMLTSMGSVMIDNRWFSSSDDVNFAAVVVVIVVSIVVIVVEAVEVFEGSRGNTS